jgi:carboxyl-terminal processing protease
MMEALPPVQRALIMSRTFEIIQSCFAHPMPPDLEALYEPILEQGLQTPSRHDFGLLMMEFLARLRNGHTLYYDSWLMEDCAQPFAFRLLNYNGQWVIGESYTPAVKAGDVITHLYDQPVEKFYAEVEPYISASSRREARTRFGYTSRLFLPDEYSLQLEDGRQVTVKRGEVQPAKPYHTEGRWLREGELAVINIPSFNAPHFESEALDYVRQFQHARCLILDLRTNGGGNTPSKLTQALMDRPYRWWAESTPATFGVFRYENERLKAPLSDWQRGYSSGMQRLERPHLMWFPRLQQPDNPLYTGKLILLISRLTGSAAEDFVMPFKDNGRAVLIGETTLGSTGQPYMFQPVEGITVVIGAKRAYFPDGGVFEGVGIAPDIEVIPDAEALRAGRDPVLEAAIQMV